MTPWMPTRSRTLARALYRRARRAATSGSERGQSLIIVILSMFVMLGMTAFVIDIADLEVAHHRAQNAADAAALSAAGTMQSASATSAQVIAEGTSIGGANDPAASTPAGSINVTQPQGATGDQAAATVTQNLHLPFGNVFGLGNGSVSATSVAQDESQFCTSTNVANCPTGTVVADGYISATGCGNTTTSFCEYYYKCIAAGCPSPGANNGPYIGVAGVGPWQITSAPEPQGADGTNGTADVDNETVYPPPAQNNGYSSVDLQGCSGALNGGSCANIPSIDGSAADPEVVDLNGDGEGGMFQTVGTVPGAKYKLEFVLTGNPAGYNQSVYSGFSDAGKSCPSLFPNYTGNVYITDNPQNKTDGSTQYVPGTSYTTATVLASYTYSHPNTASSVATFETVAFSFTAASAHTTITFNSTTGDKNELPCFFYGPEVTNITLAYPADALVQ